MLYFFVIFAKKTSMITINERNCPKNHVCPMVNRCPQQAITQSSINEAPKIDESKCTACMACVKFCRTFVLER